MKLLNLHIERMPGFELESLRFEDLSPGLNIVVGPNGSGKTTTCRSIQGLLWPERLRESSFPLIHSRWAVDNAKLRISVNGPERVIEWVETTGPTPALPHSHLADCIVITVDDLFAGSSGADSTLDQELRMRLSGGIDLLQVGQSPWLHWSERKARNEAKRVRDAQAATAAIYSSYQGLRQEERLLVELEEQRDKTSKASKRIELVRSAIDRLELQEKLSTHNQLLAEFPEGMALLTGRELETLEDIQSGLQIAEDQLREAIDQSSLSETALRQLNLSGESLSKQTLSRAKQDFEALRECYSRLRREKERFQSVSVELQQLREIIGLDNLEDRLEALKGESLTELERFFSLWQTTSHKRSALKERLVFLESEARPWSAENLQRGITTLERWLRVEEQRPILERAGGIVRDAKVVSAVSIVLVITLLFVLSQTGEPLWISGVPLCLLLFILITTKRTSLSPLKLERIEQDYLQCLLPPPQSWEVEAVSTKLVELRELLSALELEREKRVESESLKHQLELIEREWIALNNRGEELALSLDIGQDTSSLPLIFLLANLLRFRNSLLELESARSQLHAIQEEVSVRLDGINSFLKICSVDTVEDFDSLLEAFRIASELCERYFEFSDQLQRAKGDMLRAQEACSRQNDRKRRFYTELKLVDGDLAALRLRLEELPNYTEIKRSHTLLESQLQALEVRIGNASPELLELDENSLLDEHTNLKRQVDSTGDLEQRIGGIHRAISEAKSSSKLESSFTDKDRAETALEQSYQAALIAESGRFLFEEMMEEFADTTQPEVVHTASELFNSFTRGRYTLLPVSLDESIPALRAFDTHAQKTLLSNELSRGTRMQLQLAVRLAFTMQDSLSSGLPILLDEALSHTDPIRFQAIAESLLALVSQGRQVFYFASHTASLELWRNLAREFDLPPIRMISLVDSLEYRQGLTEDGLFRTTSSFMRNETASLPAFDPLGNVDSTRLGHLLEDQSVLRDLSQLGINTWGQLRNLQEQGQGSFVPAETFLELQAKCVLIETFQRSWRVGRGKTLTPELISHSCKGSKFFKPILEKAQEVNWSPAELLQKIDPKRGHEIPRLRQDTYDDFLESLLRSGHYTEEATLNHDEVQARVLQAAHPYLNDGTLRPEEVGAWFSTLWEVSSATKGSHS